MGRGNAGRTVRDFTMLPGLTGDVTLCEVKDGARVEQIDAASMDISENGGMVFHDQIPLKG